MTRVIHSVRFEPGTVTPGLERLDVVRATENQLSEDAIGVWVGLVRVPWHRVQTVAYVDVAPPKTGAIDSQMGLRSPAIRPCASGEPCAVMAMEGSNMCAYHARQSDGAKSDGITRPKPLKRK